MTGIDPMLPNTVWNPLTKLEQIQTLNDQHSRAVLTHLDSIYWIGSKSKPENKLLDCLGRPQRTITSDVRVVESIVARVAQA